MPDRLFVLKFFEFETATAKCRNRCCDHVVVSRSHEQQTKSQKISNWQTEILQSDMRHG